MNYGVYLSSSGLLTAMYRMDVAANNLANVSTTAFKPDQAFTRQRDAATVDRGLPNLPSNELLERLGSGAWLAPSRVSFRQGMIEPTSSPLDVAIDGSGFLVTREGANANLANLRLTRDGRLTINSSNQLVQATSGLPVLDVNERPITVNTAQPVSIDPDGTVRQAGNAVGRLQLVTVDDPARLRKQGDSLYVGPEGLIARRRPSQATLKQGHLERSAVDAVSATLDVMRAERAVGANTRVIAMHDELMNRAISTFGKVA